MMIEQRWLLVSLVRVVLQWSAPLVRGDQSRGAHGVPWQLLHAAASELHTGLFVPVGVLWWP